MSIRGNIIGVACDAGEQGLVREFFEFFKTPWEFYNPDQSYEVVISTQVHLESVKTKLLVLYSSSPSASESASGRIAPARESKGIYLDHQGKTFPVYGKVLTFESGLETLVRLQGASGAVVVESARYPVQVLRAGYDLFHEVGVLLSSGQPACNALVPTLEIHVSMLRNWILAAGICLVEIPPVRPGYEFMACLTHDVDFIRIRDHKFDHTALGFTYRASVGSISDWIRGRISTSRCLKNLKALLSLPAVYLGLCEDFWFQDFERFLELESDLKATYFFIPFKNRPGGKLRQRHPQRRAAAYDLTKEQPLLRKLLHAGNEVALHGIDAWHSVEKGRDERRRIEAASGNASPGVRMHWLCFDAWSARTLEESGFQYDSTIGYNDSVGYRAGTVQAFRAHGTRGLFELPLHLQDTALFYTGHMALTEKVAWTLCQVLLNNAAKYGGVLTVLWHIRSLAPERLWGDFYSRLLNELKKRRVWFGTASQVVHWFRKRRTLSFQHVEVTKEGLRLVMQSDSSESEDTDFTMRIYLPGADGKFIDVGWTGEPVVDVSLADAEAICVS